MEVAVERDIPENAPLSGWRDSLLPEPRTLLGSYVRLEPVDADRQLRPLYEASHSSLDPNLWQYLFVGPFSTEEEFEAYLRPMEASRDPLYLAVIDQHSESTSGIVSYLRMVPGHGVIEIGHIWFGPDLQRTQGATEVVYLLARHAFEDLGYRRLEWKCDAENTRSRRAAERFGFTFEGIFRQHMIIKGRNRDTAWYSLLDREWPVTREAFKKWLSPQNFDSSGQQRRGLESIRGEIVGSQGAR